MLWQQRREGAGAECVAMGCSPSRGPGSASSSGPSAAVNQRPSHCCFDSGTASAGVNTAAHSFPNTIPPVAAAASRRSVDRRDEIVRGNGAAANGAVASRASCSSSRQSDGTGGSSEGGGCGYNSADEHASGDEGGLAEVR
jgi:hypothetical protein